MIGVTSKPYTPPQRTTAIKKDLNPQNKGKQQAFNSGQNKVDPNFGSSSGQKIVKAITKSVDELKLIVKSKLNPSPKAVENALNSKGGT